MMPDAMARAYGLDDETRAWLVQMLAQLGDSDYRIFAAGFQAGLHVAGRHPRIR